jgi:hypothetical protein
LGATGRGEQSVTILYVGEVATEAHLKSTVTDEAKNPLMISSVEAAEGIIRSLDRRLHNAYVPFFMGPMSSLGSIVSMRPFLFQIGFLKEREEFKERVVALQAVKHEDLLP